VALAIYRAIRTSGLPGATDDIGNWGEMLGGRNARHRQFAVILLAGRVLERAR
jgi:hypothetical protein